MPSNDKLSLMSAAAGGDLAGSTTRIEITSLYTTVPVTLACSLQQLRTTMFAGGSGYTATDPITAGAASFTTLAASSTSALTGNVGIGGSAASVAALRLSSTVTGTNVIGIEDRTTIVGTGGTFLAKVVLANSGGITANTGGAVTTVATLALYEPAITVSSGSVTNAATLYIGNAPTEGGTRNDAIYVAAGSCYFGGAVTCASTLDATTSISVGTKLFTFGANDSAGAGYRTVTIQNA